MPCASRLFRSLRRRVVLGRAVSREGAFAALVALLCLGLAPLGCSCEDTATLPDADQRDPVTGLTPQEAEEVLVTVGDRSITLGDYAATLLRMDRFERLRYQTEERQKQLLDEMVEVEILAQEARRRGLDKDPEVQLRIAQALRDELLSELERKLPGPDTFSERDVRQYYEAHRSEFVEPLRHRVLAIAVASENVARKLVGEAQGASGEEWGELAQKHSTLRATVKPESPELAGDLGFVSAPGEARGANPDVPEEVRAAIFSVSKVGDVVDHVVASGSKYYVVRLGGISPARQRSAQEADRTIRVELRRQEFLKAEKQLEAELRKKYAVVVDDAKIAAFERQVSGPPDEATKKATPDQ